MAEDSDFIDTEVWEPEHEGQKPPFAPGNQWVLKPGNELAIKHGVYSAKRVDPRARAAIDEVLADEGAQHLLLPRFRALLWTWAVATARVEMLGEHIDLIGLEEAARSDRGQTSMLELQRKFMTTQLAVAGKLGLDAMSASRLAKTFRDMNTPPSVARVLSETRARGELAEREKAEFEAEKAEWRRTHGG